MSGEATDAGRAGDESLQRAEELLERLERTRAELEALVGSDDSERAIEVLTDLSDIAKDVEAELERARREATDDAID